MNVRICLLVLAVTVAAGCNRSASTQAAALTIDSTAPTNPQSVYGTVTDAETGLPVKVTGGGPLRAAITCSVGLVDIDTSSESWVGGLPLATTSGRYEIPFAAITGRTAGMRTSAPASPAYAIKIGAYGYVDERSPLFTLGQPVKFNAKLRKWPVPAGTVLNPDGTPAARVEVFMLWPEQSVRIENGRVDRTISRRQMAITDREGRFRFKLATNNGRSSILYAIPFFRPGPNVISSPEKYRIFVINEKGCALLPEEEFMKKDVKITLIAWGRVTGRMMRGQWPITAENVSLYSTYDSEPDHPLRIMPEYKALTDGDGRFTFDRVPAGKWAVGKLLYVPNSTKGATTVSHSVPVDVEAGKTVDVVIGGAGRAVIGKVELPAELQGNPNVLGVCMALELALPDGRPEDAYKWSPAQVAAWQKKWDDELQPELKRKRSRYIGFIDQEGTWRIESVPAGQYQWQLELYRNNGTYYYGDGTSFEVPALRAHGSDIPLDMGVTRVSPEWVKHIADFFAKP
jgi:hypothetical protein